VLSEAADSNETRQCGFSLTDLSRPANLGPFDLPSVLSKSRIQREFKSAEFDTVSFILNGCTRADETTPRSHEPLRWRCKSWTGVRKELCCKTRGGGGGKEKGGGRRGGGGGG